MFHVRFTFRNAKKKQILKAYRKLAIQWHPDKYEGDDKKHAEKVFMDIAAAKEVLTDPGKMCDTWQMKRKLYLYCI